ncbi:MAG: hypothetical protein CMM61_08105 [Rhodospirillaceae bacterium]|nr:hypothetical protein [Rhodospirillaceae bacterium]
MVQTRNAIERTLLALMLLGIGLFVAAIYVAYHSLREEGALKDIDTAQSAIVSELAAFSKIQREIGYTRFIHNFKNGVLRRDEGKLRLAQKNLESALAALDDLVALNPGLKLHTEQLRQTLDLYHSNAYFAIRLISSGIPTDEVDRAVKIDDGPAAADLKALFEAIYRERLALQEKLQALVEDRRHHAEFDVVKAGAMLLFAVALGWLLLAMRLRVKALHAAQDGLARIEAKFATHEDGAPAPGGFENMPFRNVEDRIGQLTARIEAQQRELLTHADGLSTANEELERFAYVASHDLQEPLRKIQSNIDLIGLREGAADDPDLTARLDRIARAAGQMRQLIRDLLEYSRRGSRPMNKGRIELHALIEDCAALAQENLDTVDGRITIEFIPPLSEIDGDPSMLSQVFANLFENAQKYARAGYPPDITVRGIADPDGVTITVTDNGIGFDEKYAGEIFKPFVRLHRRGERGGSGVGLSIVKRIIERHGGTITARGVPDRGAEFTIHLPPATERPEEMPVEEEGRLHAEAV